MKSTSRKVLLFIVGVVCSCVGTMVFADSGIGIAAVANTAKSNLGALAQLITAGSYVGGMGFGVASITKFKAHKDNPQQIHISQPIALLFIAAALLFIPSVFKSAGQTLFASSGTQAGIGGVSSF